MDDTREHLFTGEVVAGAELHGGLPDLVDVADRAAAKVGQVDDLTLVPSRVHL